VAIGIGRVVRQVGGTGVFAVVRLDVGMSGPQHKLELDIDIGVKMNSDAMWWLPAATVGIRYAWEKVNQSQLRTGVSVKVLEITEMTVDTTEITVVYAAALAMWDGLKLQPACPIELLPISRSLQFPI